MKQIEIKAQEQELTEQEMKSIKGGKVIWGGS